MGPKLHHYKDRDFIPMDQLQYFNSPNRIVIGWGARSQISVEANQLKVTRALIVTDRGVQKAGLTEPVEDALDSVGISYLVYDRVQPDPTSLLIDEGAQIFKAEACDLVVGVGGGSSLDTAKGISVLASNTGSIVDYRGINQVPRRGSAMILVPTTAGTGSEVTRALIMTVENEKLKAAVNSVHTLPDVAVVDPELTASMPRGLTAETGIDALTHAIEAFVATNETVFSDLLAEKAIRLLAVNLPRAYADGSDKEARANNALASTLAGMAFMSSFVGGVHALAHSLGANYHIPHGRACGVMLPHVMSFNIPAKPEKFATIAKAMGCEVRGATAEEAGEMAAQAVTKLLKTLGINTRLREYGLSGDSVNILVEGTKSEERFFATNPRKIGTDDVRRIYQAAF